MRALLRLVPLLLLVVVAACDRSATAPAAESALLQGRWLGPVDRWNDQWSPRRMERRFTFSGDGTYTWEVVSFGGYGRPESERTFFHRVHGDFRVRGGRLWTRERERETWDSFYGTTSPVHRETVAEPRFVDSYGVTRSGDRLTLDYVTYPADAPEPTRMVYRRVAAFE